jgi:hypothetical protein
MGHELMDSANRISPTPDAENNVVTKAGNTMAFGPNIPCARTLSVMTRRRRKTLNTPQPLRLRRDRREEVLMVKRSRNKAVEVGFKALKPMFLYLLIQLPINGETKALGHEGNNMLIGRSVIDTFLTPRKIIVMHARAQLCQSVGAIVSNYLHAVIIINRITAFSVCLDLVHQH